MTEESWPGQIFLYIISRVPDKKKGTGRCCKTHFFVILNAVKDLEAISKPPFPVTLSVAKGLKYLKIRDSSLRSE